MLDNLKKYDVVLASNSPRRRELLSELGVDFRVETLPGIDETPPPGLPAMQVAEYVSQVKAKAYALAPNELLITADTVVILGDEVLHPRFDLDVVLPELFEGDKRCLEHNTFSSLYFRKKYKYFITQSQVLFCMTEINLLNHHSKALQSRFF